MECPAVVVIIKPVRPVLLRIGCTVHVLFTVDNVLLTIATFFSFDFFLNCGRYALLVLLDPGLSCFLSVHFVDFFACFDQVRFVGCEFG